MVDWYTDATKNLLYLTIGVKGLEHVHIFKAVILLGIYNKKIISQKQSNGFMVELFIIGFVI